MDRAKLLSASPGLFDDFELKLITSIDVGERLVVWDAFTTFVATDGGFTADWAPSRVGVDESWIPGPHELLALGSLAAVIVRRPGATVATWRDVPVKFDYDSCVVIGPDPMPVEKLPTASPSQRPLHAWVVPLAHGTVFIDDPSGSDQISVAFGLDADGKVAALLIGLYG
ncbi:MAG: hypothetical protein QM831_05555 [Kofleriaceae bacterium]